MIRCTFIINTDHCALLKGCFLARSQPHPSLEPWTVTTHSSVRVCVAGISIVIILGVALVIVVYVAIMIVCVLFIRK